MNKIAVLVLADSQTHGDMGRIVNALEVAKEFKDGGDEVQIIFDGAGTTWIGKIADPDNQMNPLYEGLKDNIKGACGFCSNAFGVKQQVIKAGIPLLEDYDGHPSIKEVVDAGYQVISF
ncbi:MAG: hypothetical protein K9I94_11410 [Bacteroidales bacterium]|nr:hypothetical protein [Bacteroidales bacterium]